MWIRTGAATIFSLPEARSRAAALSHRRRPWALRAAGVDRLGAQGPAFRIDIHGHMTPPIVLEAMGAAELGNFAKWTPEIALAEMDRNGIETAMVSVPPHDIPRSSISSRGQRTNTPQS